MEQPRLVFPHFSTPPQWINDSTLLVSTDHHTKWFRAFLDGRLPIQIAADSIEPHFVDDGEYVLYNDYHKNAGSNPLRFIPISRWNKDGGIDPEIFDWRVPNAWLLGGGYGRARFLLCCDTSRGDLWRIWLPDRRKELVRGSCDLLKRITSLKLSWDESQYVCATENRTRDEIVVIENLFK
jgi:hypothetical protein